MPGPVSDSYDPEFGSAENAAQVRLALEKLREKLTRNIGSSDLRYIVDVVREPDGPLVPMEFMSERELRILRYAVNCALEIV